MIQTSVIRALAGIFAGFVVFIACARSVSPSDGLILNASVVIAGAIASGFLTGLIAGSHEFPAAATLGLLMIGSGFLTMRQQGLPRPGWYEMTIAGCGPVSALLGAAIWLLAKLKMKRPRGLPPDGNRSPQ